MENQKERVGSEDQIVYDQMEQRMDLKTPGRTEDEDMGSY